jgi:dynein heavy chain
MRKEREVFRQRLVALIFKQDKERLSPVQIPTPEDKIRLRYNYYIRHGIDTIHVPPLEDLWLNNICTKIPEKIQIYSTLKKQLIEEVREDYVLSMKKAAIDFVLQDPSMSDNVTKQYDSVCREDLKEMSKKWRTAFEKNLLKIQKNLHVMNPCVAQVLELWYKSFRYTPCLIHKVSCHLVSCVEREFFTFLKC